MMHDDRDRYSTRALLQLANLARVAGDHAATGCKQCELDAMALRGTIEWLKTLKQFSDVALAAQLR